MKYELELDLVEAMAAHAASTSSMRPHESPRASRESRGRVATASFPRRPGPDAAELYKTPVKDKLRRKLSPYVSFEERDTDLFHMCRVSVVNELELVTWSRRWRRCDGVVPRRLH